MVQFAISSSRLLTSDIWPEWACCVTWQTLEENSLQIHLDPVPQRQDQQRFCAPLRVTTPDPLRVVVSVNVSVLNDLANVSMPSNPDTSSKVLALTTVQTPSMQPLSAATLVLPNARRARSLRQLHPLRPRSLPLLSLLVNLKMSCFPKSSSPRSRKQPPGSPGQSLLPPVVFVHTFIAHTINAALRNSRSTMSPSSCAMPVFPRTPILSQVPSPPPRRCPLRSQSVSIDAAGLAVVRITLRLAKTAVYIANVATAVTIIPVVSSVLYVHVGLDPSMSTIRNVLSLAASAAANSLKKETSSGSLIYFAAPASRSSILLFSPVLHDPGLSPGASHVTVDGLPASTTRPSLGPVPRLPRDLRQTAQANPVPPPV